MFGQGLDCLLFGFDAVIGSLEPEALVSGLEDVAVMGKAVEERGGHFGVAEHAGPFAEAQVCCDDDAGTLIGPPIAPFLLR